MAANFYKKRLPRTPLYLPNGRRILFEPVDDNIGYYRTEVAFEIQELEKAIAQDRGGIQRITEQEYQELAELGKNSPPLTKVSQQRQWREVFPMHRGADVKPAVAAAVATKPAAPALPDPIQIPPADTFKPRTGKAKVEKKDKK